jgi:predicted TIM-barrel fold metal-dependent hydrolase
MSNAVEIVDIHTHIASDRYIPRSFIDGVVDNAVATFEASGIAIPRARLVSQYLRSLEDHLCDALVAEMDDAGISESVLLLPDFTFALRDPGLTIEEMVVEHHKVLLRHAGRLRAFVGVDPRWGADGLALFERAVRHLGFSGLKLYPPCGYSPSDPMLDPYYEICAQRALPVLVHIGPTSPALSFEKTAPFDVDSAARRFPNVRFVLAHGAVAYVEEATMMCRYRPNVFLDISGFQGRQRPGGVDPQLAALLQAGISHKILFGTDWPIYRIRGTQRDFVTSFAASSELPQNELANVLRRNAMRVLTPQPGLSS